MTTIEVLKTARGLASQGRSAEACGFGDWPDAVDAWTRANRWRPWLRRLPAVFVTKRMIVRSITRAIRLLETEPQLPERTGGTERCRARS